MLNSLKRRLGVQVYLMILSVGLGYMACGGNNGTGPSGGVQADLASIQANIFSNNCALSGCHIPGGAAPMALRNSTESFNNLVNVNSTEKPSLLRVAPGDPDNSYLVHKIEGRSDIVGGRMPLGRTPLSTEEINAIREWIANGAAPAGSSDDDGEY